MHTIILMMYPMLSCVQSDTYLRKVLFDNDKSIEDINLIKDLGPKIKRNNYIQDSDCDNSGCNIEFIREFNILFKQGFGINFIISKLGLMNKTVEVGISKLNFEVTTDYQYSVPLAKTFARWTTKNYDPSGYEECRSSQMVDSFIGADNTLIDPSDTIWKKSASKSYLRSYSPTSQNAYKCNHYWLTTLDFCAGKAIFMRDDRMLITYRLTDEVILDSEIYIKIGDSISTKKYNGKLNERETIELTDEVKIEIEPSAKILNPKYNTYIICDAIISIDNGKRSFNCKEWYFSTSIPQKGNIPQAGFGMYQLVNINNPSKLLFSHVLIDWDSNLQSCNAIHNVLTGRRNKINNNFDTDYRSMIKSLYDHDKDGLIKSNIEITHKSVINVPHSDKLMFTNDQSCCISFSSSSNHYLDSLVNNLKKLKDEIIDYDIKTKNIDILENGIPEQLTFKSSYLTSVSTQARIITQGLRINYDLNDPSIESVRITDMKYFESGAGSYFTFELVYTGPSGNVLVKSEDIELLIEQFYIHASGTITDKIGFKSRGLIIKAPIVCFGKNNICVKPEKMEKLIPADGSIDDLDDNDNMPIENIIMDFISLVYSNLSFGIVCTLMWIFDIIFSLFFIFIIIKIFSSTFSKLLFFILLCGKSNELNLNKVIESKTMHDAKPTYKILNDREQKCLSMEHESQYYPNSILEPLLKEYILSINIKTLGGKILDQTQKGKWSETLCKALDIGSDLNDITKIEIPQLTRFNYPGYPFGLHSNSSIKQSTIQDINDLINISQKNGKLWGCLIMMANRKYNWLCLQKRIDDIKEPNLDRYCFLEKVGLKTGLIEYLGHYTIGPNSNVMVIEFSGDCLTLGINIKDRALHYFKITGEYKISILTSKNCDITKHIIVIECVDRCTILSNDELTKHGMNNIKVNLRKIRHFDHFDSLKKFIKKQTLNMDNKLLLEDHKKSEWSFTDNRDSYIISNYEFKVFKKSINEISQLNDISDIDLSNAIVNTPSLYTPFGVYDVQMNGPINMACEIFDDYSFCRNEKSMFYAILKNSKYQPSSNTKVLFGNESLSVNDKVIYLNVTPVLRICTGEVYIDKTSSLYCSNDCCLMTDDDWKHFKLIEADDNYKVKHVNDKILLQKYDNTGISKHIFKSAIGCATDTFMSSWYCAWNKFPISMYFTFYWPIIFIVILTTLTILRLILTNMHKIRFSKVTRPVKHIFHKTAQIVIGEDRSSVNDTKHSNDFVPISKRKNIGYKMH
uniref:Glycoprotein n=1 Tax=Hymenopteran phasma-related virus OKIAV244 TaxID=2746316 RepID=A0A7D7F8K8_9VIRU|nr:glycoprotein [Hymenopteran phasma-related virus OKIAV244]